MPAEIAGLCSEEVGHEKLSDREGPHAPHVISQTYAGIVGLSVLTSLNNVSFDNAQSMAKEFRHVVGNRENEEWDHLCAEPE